MNTLNNSTKPGHRSFIGVMASLKPGRVPGTREWRVKDTTYAPIYYVYNGKIRILRVMHDSRQFPEQ